MKVAVSTLAWDPEQDEAAAELMRAHAIAAIEVAPMKYWPDAPRVAPDVLDEFRAAWEARGISIVALQGILFGKPQLELLGSAQQQAGFEAHLVAMSGLAGRLGASVLVLGAPRNRLRRALSEDAAIARAVPVLRAVAAAAAAHGCRLCVEPNPERYGGDFVRDIREATRLVHAVDHEGFGLHLDAGAIAITAETDQDVVDAARVAAHFHISEIDLAPIGSGSVDHVHVASLLARASFAGWRSVEMRPPERGGWTGIMRAAMDAAVATYG